MKPTTDQVRDLCHCGAEMATEYLGIENEGKPKSNVEYPSGPEWALKIVTLADGTRLRARLARCTKCSTLRNEFSRFAR
jgi:hypothetical protein